MCLSNSFLLILISGFILFYGPCELKANTFSETDSIWIIRYSGMTIPPTPPPLPDEIISDQDRIEAEKNAVVNSFNQDIINNKGHFNPTIDWDSRVVIDKKDHQKLVNILTSKDITYEPSECFEPRHSIIFFEADRIVKYYNICFECSTTKLDGEKFIDTIDYRNLRLFMIEKGIPINIE